MPFTIHSKLMLALTVFLTLLVFIFAEITTNRFRNTRVNELNNRAERMAELISHSSAHSVWNVDIPAIEKQVSSLVKDPEIVQCTISATGFGTIFEKIKSDININDPIVIIKDISYSTTATGTQKIGEVKILFTKDLVESSISESLKVLWIIFAAFLGIIYLVTYLLLKKVVSSPIEKLKRTVDTIAEGDLTSRYITKSKDEVGKLGIQINSMADSLAAADKNRRFNEKRLQLVLEGSELGYWDWDIANNTVVRNDLWAEMLGYKLNEIDQSFDLWFELQHPDDKDAAWNSLNNHLKGITSSHDIEYRMRKKDGSYIWILDHAQIVTRDKDGNPLRMCGTHRNITTKKIAEFEKETLQMKLAHSQKMESLGQLTGGIAHDFNNMLTGIIGAAQVLKSPKRNLDEKGMKFAELIIESSIKAADLIKKLLAFGRKTELNLTPVNISKIIEDSLDILERTISKDIEISTIMNAENITITGDHTALENVILNLAINASHAMNKGGKILIKTENITLDDYYCDSSVFELYKGEYCKIDIIDSGIGIPKENLSKIFEPFFTTKEEGKGTGLGLAAVYGTIKDLKGEIKVTSEVNKGTTFTIILPCSDILELSKTKNRSQKLITKKHILFVDDDATNRTIGKELLEDLGHNVTVAEDGSKAISIYLKQHSKIDLIIIDMTMPVLNGSKTFAQLKKINQECKVILTSGNLKEKELIELKDEGLTDFIQKPYSIEQLQEKINIALNY